MRSLTTVVALAALALTGAGTSLVAENGTSIEIVGAPAGTVVEIALNGGKIADAPANAVGDVAAVLDFANLGKPQVRMQVWLEVCQDGRMVVHLVSDDPDGRLPDDDGSCDRRAIGAFWTNRATRIVVNAGTGVLQVSNAGMSSTMKYALGGGAAAIGGLALLGGGNDSPAFSSPPSNTTAPPPVSAPPPAPPPAAPASPAGDYKCTACAVESDPDHHDPTLRFCDQLTGTFNVFVNSPMRIEHPAPWVTLNGDFNESSLAFSGSGTGTVAGFSNVAVSGQGPFQKSGDAFTGAVLTVTVGTNGVFPGGRPTTYRVTLVKQ